MSIEHNGIMRYKQCGRYMRQYQRGGFVEYKCYERLEQAINVLTEQADLRAEENKRIEGRACHLPCRAGRVGGAEWVR